MTSIRQYVQDGIRNALKSTLNLVNLDIVRKVDIDDSHDFNMYHRLFPEESIEHRRFYVVGAGGHFGFGVDFDHPYWTNIDLKRPDDEGHRPFDPSRDIAHDLLEAAPLPLEDGKAEIILSQYAMEHIPNEAARFFFRDALRSLKPGGILRIVTPNAQLDLNAYRNRDASYYHWVDWFSSEDDCKRMGYGVPLNQASFEQVFLTHFAAGVSCIHVGENPEKFSDADVRRVMDTMRPEEALDHFTARCSVSVERRFRHNHMNWWTPEKLIQELKEAGFEHVNVLAPLQSNSPVMRNPKYFDRLWNEVATFVEAVK